LEVNKKIGVLLGYQFLHIMGDTEQSELCFDLL